mmetsp:Transcript_16363/g.22551  ORF Transcript_16363/g.22551 Transcript_16363/m.22551 type:complete len:149 (-) Transcript_16363:252-698(-)
MNAEYSIVVAETAIVQTNTNSTNYLETATADNNSKWTVATIFISIALFILAGIFEVGGGYLVWIGVREKRLPWLFIPIGCIILVLYGFVPTLQPVASFGRIFAVYGGFFIVLSYGWAMVFDGFKMDTGDYIGAAIALAGVSIAWFWPR